jgi:chemotaxis family two-component system sensor kinase Cph1
MTGSNATADDLCAQEPIQIPGSIQPHGALLVVDRDSLDVLQASANTAEFLGNTFTVSAGLDGLSAESGEALATRLKVWLASGEPIFRDLAIQADRRLEVTGHLGVQGVILEFEDVAKETLSLDRLHHRLQRFLDTIEPMEDLSDIAAAAVAEIAALSGFDRVMTYSFSEDGSGIVLAEASTDGVARYRDLRFPASDIPAQARRLYVANRLRLIADVDYRPVPLAPLLSPKDGQPLDMVMSTLRSVSPIHLDYMRNMGTRASMSVSLVIDGQLWGLIACHHDTPRRVPPRIRSACEMTGRVVAQQIGARLRMAEAAERLVLNQIGGTLLTYMAQEESLGAALRKSPALWLRFATATGSAVLVQDAVETLGEGPSAEQIVALGSWLRKQGIDTVYETDSLSAQFPEAAAYGDTASGLLAISVSQLHASYIMWFRPEAAREVQWAGDPTKLIKIDEAGRPGLSPRNSFEAWTQQVHRRAIPWHNAEAQSAADFRHAIISLVLRQAEVRAEMSSALEKTNAELESFSYSVSHDLRAPFRHIVGFAELLGERERALDPTSRRYLDTIIDSALSAGHLVDDLLSFSQLGRASLAVSPIDMGKLVREVAQSLEADMRGREILLEIGDLPPAMGDPGLLRQAVFNLLGNAVKYTRGRTPARIALKGEAIGNRCVYQVIDNGTGYDMRYADKLFGVFQRLHRVDDFEGTGIGLALTKRIVERHGGRISATSILGEGATFTFELPRSGGGGGA